MNMDVDELDWEYDGDFLCPKCQSLSLERHVRPTITKWCCANCRWTRECKLRIETMGAYEEELKGVVVLSPMEGSFVDFARAVKYHIEEEQSKINPDNALIATLCNAVRMGKEYLDYQAEIEKKIVEEALQAR